MPSRRHSLSPKEDPHVMRHHEAIQRSMSRPLSRQYALKNRALVEAVNRSSRGLEEGDTWIIRRDQIHHKGTFGPALEKLGLNPNIALTGVSIANDLGSKQVIGHEYGPGDGFALAGHAQEIRQAGFEPKLIGIGPYEHGLQEHLARKNPGISFIKSYAEDWVPTERPHFAVDILGAGTYMAPWLRPAYVMRTAESLAPGGVFAIGSHLGEQSRTELSAKRYKAMGGVFGTSKGPHDIEGELMRAQKELKNRGFDTAIVNNEKIASGSIPRWGMVIRKPPDMK